MSALAVSTQSSSSTSTSTAVEVKTADDIDNQKRPSNGNGESSNTIPEFEFDVGSLGSTYAPPLAAESDSAQFRASLTRGSTVDCQDGDSMWYESIIEDSTADSVTVRFLGWSRKWNALLRRDSQRIAPRNSKVPNWRQTLTPGKCVEVSTSDSCTWCTAVVSVVEPTRFQVIRAPACTTEWHDINSLLIAEPYTHCGYKIEADARERRRMLAARRNLFNIELQICYGVRAMSSRIKVAEHLGEQLLGIPSNVNVTSNCTTITNNNSKNNLMGEDEMKEGGSNAFGNGSINGTDDCISTGQPLSTMENFSMNLNDSSSPALYISNSEPTPFSDVTFLVEGEKIHAHRVILCARSPYFRRMFLGGMREARETNTKEISLTDTRAVTFQCVIKYIYTGLCSVNHNNALELLHAAHLFCLDGLAKAIEVFLFRAVSTETALEIIIAANTFNLIELKAHCVEYIIDHYETFVPNLAKLSNHPQILITIMESMRKPKKRRGSSFKSTKETTSTNGAHLNAEVGESGVGQSSIDDVGVSDFVDDFNTESNGGIGEKNE